MARQHARRGVALALAAAALAVIAIAWHLAALTAYDTSAGTGTLVSRINAAELAAHLEPWSERFQWRVVTLRAQRLLNAGRIDEAFWLLEPLSQIVRGDALYRSVYQEAVHLKAPLDARKAHVQHAKEKAGGVLDPADVQR